MGITYKKFDQLTPEERKMICNGCGGKGSWIKPPHKLFFKACCDRHDYGYWKGGDEKRREYCDLKFYDAMLEDANKVSNWFSRQRYKAWAWLYFKAVRINGKKYFDFK